MSGRTAAILAAVVAGAIAALVLGWFARRRFDRWRRRRRLVRGQHAEGRAAAVLARAGYDILAEQPQTDGELLVDGVAQSYTVRGDFLCARGGARYLVEVKSGRSAPNPASSATRRQLLEYALLYDVDGVLLLDMEREQIAAIAFPSLAATHGGGRGPRALWPFALCLALGVIAGWLAARL